MRYAIGFRVPLAVAWAMICVPALGQRVEIPSPLPSSTFASSPADLGPATLEGTIQPASPFDPYATPGVGTPSLLSQDPYIASGAGYGVGGTFTKWRRALDELRFEYLWMPGSSSSELGINDMELSAAFAVPFLYNTETPLLVRPGFAFHWLSGPASPGVDLPPVVYDAYLDTSWNPRVNDFLSGEIAVRVGVYSDFKKVTLDSIRLPSTGQMVLTFSPSFKIKAGVIYLDRHPAKILPAGGVIWTPNADVRFDLIFPNPKVTRRITTYGNTEWWGYLRADYGGGAWTIDRVDKSLGQDLVGYNDYRFAAGLEFKQLSGLTGLIEMGVAFERQLLYRSHSPEKFYVNTTVFLRAGLAY